MTKGKSEVWAIGAAYEPYVGRWSRLVAKDFLTWLNVTQETHWLDVGCGTGALSQTILGQAQPREVTGVDSSEGFVSYAKQQTAETNITFVVADARTLPFAGESFDVAVSGLVLNFVPEPEKAVAEMARVTKSGGTVAAYVWDYSDKMEFMRYFWDAAVALDPEILDEGKRFPLCQPEPLAKLFHAAGFGRVEVRAIDTPTVFRDFDDYWSPFLGGQGTAPGYAMSLSKEKRDELRDSIHSHLPIKPDGSIHLIARAWAVRGMK
jgi:ubiquinone/menaquinone biosynthesis C-methylase UbiE